MLLNLSFASVLFVCDTDFTILMKSTRRWRSTRVAEDFVDPLEAHAPRADGIVEDIKENAFNLFQEDWEQLCVDEKNDPANRFRLSHKY